MVGTKVSKPRLMNIDQATILNATMETIKDAWDGNVLVVGYQACKGLDRELKDASGFPLENPCNSCFGLTLICLEKDDKSYKLDKQQRATGKIMRTGTSTVAFFRNVTKLLKTSELDDCQLRDMLRAEEKYQNTIWDYAVKEADRLNKKSKVVKYAPEDIEVPFTVIERARAPFLDLQEPILEEIVKKFSKTPVHISIVMKNFGGEDHPVIDTIVTL